MDISTNYTNNYIADNWSSPWLDMPNPFTITLTPTERALQLLCNCMDGRPWQLIKREQTDGSLRLVFIPAEESAQLYSESIEFCIYPCDDSIEQLVEALLALNTEDHTYATIHEQSASSCLYELHGDGQTQLVKAIKEGPYLGLINYCCDASKTLDLAKWARILNTFSFSL